MPDSAPSPFGVATAGAVPVRVVIVTLDNHLGGAVERAQARLAAEGSGISAIPPPPSARRPTSRAATS